MNVDPNIQLQTLIEGFKNHGEFNYIEKEKVISTSGREISTQTSNGNVDSKIIDFIVKNKGSLNTDLLRELDSVLSARVSQIHADLESFGPLSFLFSYFFAGPNAPELQKEADRLEIIKQTVDQTLLEAAKAPPHQPSPIIAKQTPLEKSEEPASLEIPASVAPPPPPPPPEKSGTRELRTRLINEPDLPKCSISTGFQQLPAGEIQQQIDDLEAYLKKLKESIKPLQESLKEKEMVETALEEANVRLKEDEKLLAKFHKNLRKLNESEPEKVRLFNLLR